MDLVLYVGKSDVGRLDEMRHDDGASEGRSRSPASQPIDDALAARIQALSRSHRVSGTFSVAAGHARGAATSFVQEVTCIRSGHRHSGLMQVTGAGDHQIVSVRYGQSELDADAGTIPTATVAEELLERLVLQEAIAIKVQAGEPQHRDDDRVII